MPDSSPLSVGEANKIELILALSRYAATFTVEQDSALETARHCLIDALGRGFVALRDPECAPLIAPVVPGALLPGGARVPGTSLELEPVQAAFCICLMLCRRVDADHWLASVRPRATDWIGALLAVADYEARRATMEGRAPLKVRDLLAAIVKTLEIHGVIVSFEERYFVPGEEPFRLARAAVTAVATAMLGGAPGQITAAVCYATLDGDLYVDPAEPCSVPRGYWGTAEAVSRAVRRACQATAGARVEFLDSADMRIVAFAGGQLGVRDVTPKKSFGTAIVDRLTAARKPRHVTQLMREFHAAVTGHFPARQAERIKALFDAPRELDELPVNELIAALVTNGTRRREPPPRARARRLSRPGSRAKG